jgi:uncharacterized protein (DUF2267 family)
MNYQSFIAEVQESGIIKDNVTAGRLIKAVLGLLTSEIKEKTAHRLADRLPEPLTYERLREHQKNPLNISFEESVSEISNQFNIRPIDAKQLINKIYHAVKLELDSSSIEEIKGNLPSEWAEAFAKA